MAVYTFLEEEEIADFLTRYQVGTLVSAKGIAEGVENTNYLLTTEQPSTSGVNEQHYILTLYEKRVKEEDLPFFIALMQHLAERGVQVPRPIKDRQGQDLQSLGGRKALLTSFLNGLCKRRPQAEHCRQLGSNLAQLHLACKDFEGMRPNALNPQGWQKLVDQCASKANTVKTGLSDMIVEEIAYLTHHWPEQQPDLSFGTCHADLFPDNVFFLKDQLSGLIDFYFACTDFHAYDLAICLNSWCFEKDYSFNLTKAKAMIEGYQSMRPLTKTEQTYFCLFARGAAFRFLMTRLYDWLNTPADALVTPHDPLVFYHYLQFHRHVVGKQDYGL